MISRRHFLSLTAVPLLAQTDLDWHDARKFQVEGLGFTDLKSPFDRLPSRAEGVVREVVWNLSRDSSGVLVRFTANTAEIHARWTVTNKNLAAANITATASSGLDLYAKTDAGRRTLALARHRTAYQVSGEYRRAGYRPASRQSRIHDLPAAPQCRHIA